MPLSDHHTPIRERRVVSRAKKIRHVADGLPLGNPKCGFNSDAHAANALDRLEKTNRKNREPFTCPTVHRGRGDIGLVD
jgi:hypothetical protein